jgi:hypothetical protein
MINSRTSAGFQKICAHIYDIYALNFYFRRSNIKLKTSIKGSRVKRSMEHVIKHVEHGESNLKLQTGQSGHEHVFVFLITPDFNPPLSLWLSKEVNKRKLSSCLIMQVVVVVGCRVTFKRHLIQGPDHVSVSIQFKLEKQFRYSYSVMRNNGSRRKQCGPHLHRVMN